MTLSVRELKTQLGSRGIDFSHCCEKVELQKLLDDAISKEDTSGYPETSSERPPQVAIPDESFAEHPASGRKCWVEFVDDDDALCHWDDGKDSIISARELHAISRSNLPCPSLSTGSFEEARALAFSTGKLLIASVQPVKPTRGCKNENLHHLVLASDDVAALVEENAIFWRGSNKELREPHLQQLAPKGVPSLAMVLPLAADAMRVLSQFESMTAETLVSAFVEALEAFENHRKEKETRLLCEEALLRQDQDEEFQAALAADQKASEEAARLASESAAVDDGNEAATNSSKRDNVPEESEEERLAKARKVLADEFASSVPSKEDGAKVCKLVLRLPGGGRVERAFGAGEALSRVRMWVACCQYLPETEGRELQIPAAFKLSMAFPPKTFSTSDDDKTLDELGLCPSAALLVIADDSS